MIMAKDSNNNYVKIEDIKQQNSFNGVSPIKFKGSGENLENYRIYGNTIGGESVGDRTGNLFDGEIERGSFDGSTGEETNSNIRVRSGKVRLTADNYTINADGVSHGVVYVYALNGDFIKNKSITTWTELPVNFEIDISYDVRFCFRKNDNSTLIPSDIMNIMLNSDSEPLPYEPYGYKVPVTVEGKNLLQNTATSQTINGVTFTVNDDGSITCNGTAEQIIFLSINNYIRIDGNVILSGCPDGGGSDSYMLRINSSGTITARDQGSGANAINPRGMVEIRIASGYTCNNVTFYPMIRKADIENDTYEPYIADTELDITLPTLPTLSGTNTLSVGTEIKPSKVWGRLSAPRDIEYVKDNLGNILFSKYHEVEDEPPLTFKAKKEGALKDYRIYGNTVNGESVGDRTRNLFDGTFIHRSVIETIVGDDNPNRRAIVVDVSSYANGNKITFSRETSAGNQLQMYQVSSPLKGGVLLNGNVFSGNSEALLATITLDNISNYPYLMIFLNGASNPITDEELLASKIMVNVGNTPLPYEPYGYKVPVTVEGINLFDMKKFAETAYQLNATVNYSENSLIFTSKNLNAFVNGAFSQSNVAGQFRPSCINVHPLTTYTISMNTPYECYISWIDDSFNPVDAYTTIPPNQPSYTFTTPSNCTKLHIRLGKRVTNIGDTFTISTIMLNEGSTALPYEPYHAPATTPIYLLEPIKMVGDEAEYIDYAEQKQHRVRKNLLQNTGTSQTINGVTFTFNSDGSVTCNGTASANAMKNINLVSFKLNNFILNGCPTGGGWDTFQFDIIQAKSPYTVLYRDVGTGVSVDTLNENVYFRIRIASGYTCNNLTFFPMIRLATIEDDTYEPYIADTELDVTLPALPTLSGTNTLTVGTEVKPSEVYIKGKIKEIN